MKGRTTEGSPRTSQKTKLRSKTAVATKTSSHSFDQHSGHINQPHKPTHRGGKY